MVTHVDVDVPQLWRDYRTAPTLEMRNQLVELYLPLVRYNAERIWARLPEGVDLDDLISAGVFGLMDAIEAFDLERGGRPSSASSDLRTSSSLVCLLRTRRGTQSMVRSSSSMAPRMRGTQ